MMETTMLCLQPDLGFKASALKKHWESEEKFGVKDFTGATLKCKEDQVSFIECLSEWQLCVTPDVVESRSVDVYVSLAGSN